jgi:hypothetical protein
MSLLGNGDRMAEARAEIGRRLRKYCDASSSPMPDRLADLIEVIKRAERVEQPEPRSEQGAKRKDREV